MNPFKIKWDLFIIILAVFNSVTLPIELSVLPPFMKGNNLLAVINHLIDLMFFIDILVSFKTTYVNKMTGDEITNKKQISINYLKGSFWVDVVSTIPFDVIVEMFDKYENESKSK